MQRDKLDDEHNGDRIYNHQGYLNVNSDDDLDDVIYGNISADYATKLKCKTGSSSSSSIYCPQYHYHDHLHLSRRTLRQEKKKQVLNDSAFSSSSSPPTKNINKTDYSYDTLSLFFAGNHDELEGFTFEEEEEEEEEKDVDETNGERENNGQSVSRRTKRKQLHLSIDNLFFTARYTRLPLAKRLALDYYIKHNILENSGSSQSTSLQSTINTSNREETATSTGECGCCFQHNNLDTQNLLIELDDCYRRIYSAREKGLNKAGTDYDIADDRSIVLSNEAADDSHYQDSSLEAFESRICSLSKFRNRIQRAANCRQAMVHGGQVDWNDTRLNNHFDEQKSHKQELKIGNNRCLFIDDNREKKNKHQCIVDCDNNNLELNIEDSNKTASSSLTWNGFDYNENQVIQCKRDKQNINTKTSKEEEPHFNRSQLGCIVETGSKQQQQQQLTQTTREAELISGPVIEGIRDCLNEDSYPIIHQKLKNHPVKKRDETITKEDEADYADCEDSSSFSWDLEDEQEDDSANQCGNALVSCVSDSIEVTNNKLSESRTDICNSQSTTNFINLNGKQTPLSSEAPSIQQKRQRQQQHESSSSPPLFSGFLKFDDSIYNEEKLSNSHCSLTDDDSTLSLTCNSTYQNILSHQLQQQQHYPSPQDTDFPQISTTIITSGSLLDDNNDNISPPNSKQSTLARGNIINAPSSSSSSLALRPTGSSSRIRRRLSLEEINYLNNHNYYYNVALSSESSTCSSMRALKDIAKMSAPSLSSVQYLPDRMDARNKIKSNSYTPTSLISGSYSDSSRNRSRSPRLRLSPVPFKSPPSLSTQIEDGLKVCSTEHFEKHIGNIKDNQIETQKHVFTSWINHYCPNLIQYDLVDEFRDGIKLIKLLASLTKDKKLFKHYDRLTKDQQSYINRMIITPNSRLRHLSNVSIAIDYMKENLNMKLINLNPMDIVSGKANVVLGLCWNIILNFQCEQNFLRYVEVSCGGGTNSASTSLIGTGDYDSLLSISISTTRSASRNSNGLDDGPMSRSDGSSISPITTTTTTTDHNHQQQPQKHPINEFYIEEKILLDHINKRFNINLNNLSSDLSDGQALFKIIGRLVEKPEEQLVINSKGLSWNNMSEQDKLEHCFSLANTYLNVPRLFSATDLKRQLSQSCPSKGLLIYLSMLLSSDDIVMEKPTIDNLADQLLTEALVMAQKEVGVRMRREALKLASQERSIKEISNTGPHIEPPEIIISDSAISIDHQSIDSYMSSPSDFIVEMASTDQVEEKRQLVKAEKTVEIKSFEAQLPTKLNTSTQKKNSIRAVQKQVSHQHKNNQQNHNQNNRKQLVRRYQVKKNKANFNDDDDHSKETSMIMIIWKKLVRAYNGSFSINIVLLVCLAGICVMPLVHNRDAACCDERSLNNIPSSNFDFLQDKPI